MGPSASGQNGLAWSWITCAQSRKVGSLTSAISIALVDAALQAQ
jgi:hypothetical protein